MLRYPLFVCIRVQRSNFSFRLEYGPSKDVQNKTMARNQGQSKTRFIFETDFEKIKSLKWVNMDYRSTIYVSIKPVECSVYEIYMYSPNIQ